MHKVLQAIVDTFLLAAGSVALGSTADSSVDHSRDRRHRTTAKPRRTPSEERAGRPEPQSLVGEPAFRARVDKSQL